MDDWVRLSAGHNLPPRYQMEAEYNPGCGYLRQKKPQTGGKRAFRGPAAGFLS